jgi:hypothetical protein
MKNKGGLSTTMSHERPVSGPMPVVREANTSGDNPPFQKPHSRGPNTIPVIFRQGNLEGASEAAQVESTMGKMRK